MSKPNQNTKSERKLRLSARANSVIGALVSGLGAGALSLVTGDYHWRTLVPLAFTIVLLLIAVLFGSRAGIVGTIIAGTIFAAFLFQPLGNLSVMDSSARSNLAWMLLIGVSFSFLFAPPTSGLHRQ
jgi:K+-sensing histidine kinase KdpD